MMTPAARALAFNALVRNRSSIAQKAAAKALLAAKALHPQGASPSLAEPADRLRFLERLAGHVHSIDTLRNQGGFKFLVKPDSSKYPVSQLKATPKSRGLGRAAVAIDCEMVQTKVPELAKASSEVARLCAVDVLTNEVLIDAWVRPQGKVVDYHSSISGVTERRLKNAEASGTLLKGFKEAREALYQHIDDNTILVGHGLENDLYPLRMLHTRLVDTALISKLAMDAGLAKVWGLKHLSNVFLGRVVQRKKKAHCPVEDVQAVVDILRLIVGNPTLLEIWAREIDNAQREINALRAAYEAEIGTEAAEREQKEMAEALELYSGEDFQAEPPQGDDLLPTTETSQTSTPTTPTINTQRRPENLISLGGF